jgi:molecular chaperone DnaJ
LRLPGRGHVGDPGEPAGDLYVEVAVAEDERFVRDGLDILTKLTIPVADAMTGVTATVPTIAGETEIELPAGTQPFAEHVLRGKGFHALQGRGRGDQRVIVEVAVPKVTSPQGRELLSELAKHAEERGSDDGLLGRIRSVFR